MLARVTPPVGMKRSAPGEESVTGRRGEESVTGRLVRRVLQGAAVRGAVPRVGTAIRPWRVERVGTRRSTGAVPWCRAVAGRPLTLTLTLALALALALALTLREAAHRTARRRP